jgi:uncharacterized RDD family membrane protein YckC
MDEHAGARFADRLNAFLVDALLFSGGYFLSAMAFVAFLRGQEPQPNYFLLWAVVWAGFFLLYHAYFSSEGRRTLGKRLFGLRVVALDGGEPGAGASAARACGYLVSSLLLNLGFLWALRKDGRAWHDLLAGTRVVEDEPRSPGFRTASSAAAWIMGIGLAAAWVGLVVVGPGLARMRLLANARIGLKSLAHLEEKHHDQTGAYTPDLDRLLSFDPEAREIAPALPLYVNVGSIRLSGGKDSYAVEAEALDDERTRLRLQGPAPALTGR